MVIYVARKNLLKIENKTQPSLCLQTWLQQNLRISTNHKYRIYGRFVGVPLLLLLLSCGGAAAIALARLPAAGRRTARGFLPGRCIQLNLYTKCQLMNIALNLCTFSREFLQIFFIKIRKGPNGILKGLGETNQEKKN
jgi:hypothetical protein